MRSAEFPFFRPSSPELKWTLILLSISFLGQSLFAQYFGRNKPRYEEFEFSVVETPHFEIYHYLDNPEYVRALSSGSEKWYSLHQRIFGDTVFGENPVIFYNDHADFQQTNTIGGSISVGTGGVTEALKNRVIMPLAMTEQQTDHVLGHEMVHAFQYSLVLNGDSMSLQNLGNLPLWMVEGLAEYMSIGRVDAHTAMWMRDAVLHDDVPSLKKLNNPKYFPYRWGQVFWAFLTGLKGDDIIQPFFKATAKYGLEGACTSILGMSSENLSELWVSALKRHYSPYIGEGKEDPLGKPIISSENAGRMNISPALSPNGRYVIFFSEKDVFTLDLYLADARSGEIIRKVASTLRDGHLDDFSFIESAGTWSPDGRQFAIVAVSKGDNVLVIKDAEKGKTLDEIRPKGLPAFGNPAWSPDGRHIVVSGLVNGQVDLYQVDVRTGKVEQLTNDVYSESMASWSSDGSRLVYSTDELSRKRGRTNGQWTFNLAEMDLATGQVRQIDVFPGADNLNPLYNKEDDLVFLSNRDGFRNIYRYEFASGKVFQITDLVTGVSGITQYAPAITIGGNRDRLLYTHFNNGTYTIYRAEDKQVAEVEVDPNAVDMGPATLIRLNPKAPDLVEAGLDQMARYDDLAASDVQKTEYQSKFRLDFVTGGGGVGVGNNPYGSNTLLAGGVTLLFSDILGDKQLVSTLALNGEIFDAGGQIAYINRKNRFGWGAGFTHIPYPSFSYPRFSEDQVLFQGQVTNVIREDYYVRRIFEDRFDLFGQLPFSVTQRVEAGVSAARYSWRVDSVTNFYLTDETFSLFGPFIGQEREKVDAPAGFNLFTANAAYVGDNSFFGVASPLQGYRYRFGSEYTFGEYGFFTGTADIRGYKFLKPVSLAARFTHFGRYGGDANRFPSIYLGYPWFIRGYDADFVNETGDVNGLSVDNLLGSKIALAGFEVRLPLTGPERISLIKSGFLLTELALFLDGGVAWNDFEQFSGEVFWKDPVTGENYLFPEAQPVFSTGASLRVNLFGALVLEPYLARPLQKKTRWIFGLNIVPGW